MTRLSQERRCLESVFLSCANHVCRLINVLKAANQPVPDELLKFGTTVKRKEHEAYGAFAKDVDMTKTAKKIKFD
jgi:ATP-dependent RNA helicase DBP3